MSTAVDPAEPLSDFEMRQLEVMEKLLAIRKARLEFATEHHLNTKGERMDFEHYPHIRALYNSLAADIVLQGSVQCFKSEWSVIDHFASAYVGLSIFYVVPKFEARTTYVQNRINRVVENVPEYKKIVKDGFFDSVAMKNFGAGVIKYVGSNVLADFKEFPADMLFVEEVDECDKQNVEYALDRLRASKFQFRRYLGNPKLRGRGINGFFQMSDQREWFVPCLECGNFHELDWFETVVKAVYDESGEVVDYLLRDEIWEPGCRRDIKIICPDCGGELERASIRGEWRPKNPKSQIEGYHISMLCNPINSVSGMWDRFQKGLTDPGKMQQFFNSDLGLPYSAMGSRVTTEVLDGCVEDGFSLQIQPDCAHVRGNSSDGPCTMGVDVGGVLDVQISQLVERNNRKKLFFGKVRTIDELVNLCELYNVEVAVMDSMPEATLAQDFQELAPCDVWLCRYRNEGTDRRRTYDTRDRIINIDRTEALDRSFAKLRAHRTILPENYELVLGGAFLREMCNPVREVVEDTKGNAKYEWKKCVDHQRHADTYDLLAAELAIESVLDAIEVG